MNNMVYMEQFVKDHMGCREDQWKKMLLMIRPKQTFCLLEKRYVWNGAFHHKDFIQSVKGGGGSIMLFGPVLLHLGQDRLTAVLEQRVLNSSRKIMH